MVVASVIWRRLDVPGHDACRFLQEAGGWRLEGTAVWRQGESVARFDYQVVCDHEWRVREGHVGGWLGADAVDLSFVQTGVCQWLMNGKEQPGLEDCSDLDLGFTPATNLIPIRRLDLKVGQAADAPAAWLDFPTDALVRLPQRYERRTESAYWYESPTAGYEALLEVDPNGFVRRYPKLWEAED